jgi:hypothetical protein
VHLLEAKTFCAGRGRNSFEACSTPVVFQGGSDFVCWLVESKTCAKAGANNEASLLARSLEQSQKLCRGCYGGTGTSLVANRERYWECPLLVQFSLACSLTAAEGSS